jgi:hypothetical protein
MMNNGGNPAPEDTAGAPDLKDMSREDFVNLMKNPRQVLTENGEAVTDRYFSVETDYSHPTQLNWVEVDDSISKMKIITLSRNDYGYEIVREPPSGTSALWFVRLSNDTLYYTSPEYPPRTVCAAGRYNTPDFEADKQEVWCRSFLKDILCRTETVAGTRNNIAGRWKLMKDLTAPADYSCRDIIYDFRPDGQLQITGGTEDDPPGIRPGIQTWSYTDYPFCSLCLCSACPPNLLLGATGGVYCEVLKRTMVIYASEEDTLPGEPAKILVRI